MNPFTKPNLIRALPIAVGLTAFVTIAGSFIYGTPFLHAAMKVVMCVIGGVFFAMLTRLLIDESGLGQ